MPDKGWKIPGAAEQYFKTVEVVAPGRKEILELIVRLAAVQSGPNQVILDIGCGWGQVTDEILKAAPQADLVLLDYSPEMIQVCRQKYQAHQNITIYERDLNQGLGSLAPERFDAVVSCFALHHVEYANRVSLYSDIRAVLKPGGLFINGDLFKASSPRINEWEIDHYIAWMQVQLREKLGQEYSLEELKSKQLDNYERMGDKPGTLWDMQKDLIQASFQHVDCMGKYQNLAVIVASKD